MNIVKYLVLAIAVIGALFSGFFGISYKLPEAVTFALFLLLLGFWYGLIQNESSDNSAFSSSKLVKMVMLSLVEIFVVFSFVNVILFSDFYISDILRVTYLIRVLSLLILYWFSYFTIKSMMGMSESQ